MRIDCYPLGLRLQSRDCGYVEFVGVGTFISLTLFTQVGADKSPSPILEKQSAYVRVHNEAFALLALLHTF